MRPQISSDKLSDKLCQTSSSWSSALTPSSLHHQLQHSETTCIWLLCSPREKRLYWTKISPSLLHTLPLWKPPKPRGGPRLEDAAGVLGQSLRLEETKWKKDELHVLLRTAKAVRKAKIQCVSGLGWACVCDDSRSSVYQSDWSLCVQANRLLWITKGEVQNSQARPPTVLQQRWGRAERDTRSYPSNHGSRHPWWMKWSFLPSPCLCGDCGTGPLLSDVFSLPGFRREGRAACH